MEFSNEKDGLVLTFPGIKLNNIRLKLKHGEYQIKFIVDGEWTISDHLETVADADGNINNLLVVEPVTNVDDEGNEDGHVDVVMESLESVDKVTDHLTEINNIAVETVEVTLKWTGPAQHVTVAGDFSNWRPLTLSQEERDLWKILLKVKQGSHLVKFTVDGVDTVSDLMEKHVTVDNEVFNILDVSVDNLKVSQEPSDGTVDSPTEKMQCNPFNDGVIGQAEASKTDLEISELIRENKCQNLVSGANMNEEEFARAEIDIIDEAEIGGNVGVCVKNVQWKGVARDVRVVGDFSNWTPISLSNLDSDHSHWSLSLKLPQGPHLLKFIVDKKFILSEELEKVIGPDQELYNLVQVGDIDCRSREIRYESDSEPTSMVVIDSEESRDYVFKPFDGSLVETGHWVETGYNNFATLTPEDLSIIYEEDTIGQSHVELIESNEPVGKFDRETEDASDFDKASTELTNEKQMLINDKLRVTAKKKHSDDSLSPYCESPEDEQEKNRLEVVDTCIRWIGFARHVQVIGDFSNWVPLILSNERDDDWQVVLKLPFGRYLMKFIVDGRYVISDRMERRRGPDGEIYNLLGVTNDLEQPEEMMRTKSSPVESFTADSLQDSGYDQSFEAKQFSSSSSTNDDYDKESQVLGSLTPEIEPEALQDVPDIPIVRTDTEQLSVFLGCETINNNQTCSTPQLDGPGSDDVTNIPIIRTEEEQLSVFDGSTVTKMIEAEIRTLVRQITEDATQELQESNNPTQQSTMETDDKEFEMEERNDGNNSNIQQSETKKIPLELNETNKEMDEYEPLGTLHFDNADESSFEEEEREDLVDFTTKLPEMPLSKPDTPDFSEIENNDENNLKRQEDHENLSRNLESHEEIIVTAESKAEEGEKLNESPLENIEKVEDSQCDETDVKTAAAELPKIVKDEEQSYKLKGEDLIQEGNVDSLKVEDKDKVLDEGSHESTDCIGSRVEVETQLEVKVGENPFECVAFNKEEPKNDGIEDSQVDFDEKKVSGFYEKKEEELNKLIEPPDIKTTETLAENEDEIRKVFGKVEIQNMESPAEKEERVPKIDDTAEIKTIEIPVEKYEEVKDTMTTSGEKKEKDQEIIDKEEIKESTVDKEIETVETPVEKDESAKETIITSSEKKEIVKEFIDVKIKESTVHKEENVLEVIIDTVKTEPIETPLEKDEVAKVSMETSAEKEEEDQIENVLTEKDEEAKQTSAEKEKKVKEVIEAVKVENKECPMETNQCPVKTTDDVEIGASEAPEVKEEETEGSAEDCKEGEEGLKLIGEKENQEQKKEKTRMENENREVQRKTEENKVNVDREIEQDSEVAEQAIIDDMNIQSFIDKNNQLLSQSKTDELEQTDSNEDKEQAIIDDMNIQNFIDKNNQMLSQSKTYGNEDKETVIGNVNDAFVNCDDEIPNIKNEEVESNTSTNKVKENEVVRSAIDAVEANVAKIEEALKVQEVTEDVESEESSAGEAKSKPLMKSICNMCSLM